MEMVSRRGCHTHDSRDDAGMELSGIERLDNGMKDRR